MLDQVSLPKMLTPEEAAVILRLSKNTVYDLIQRGEILAKKIGRVYRIPQKSLSFALTGLDEDLYQAEKKDLTNLELVEKEITKARKSL